MFRNCSPSKRSESDFFEGSAEAAVFFVFAPSAENAVARQSAAMTQRVLRSERKGILLLSSSRGMKSTKAHYRGRNDRPRRNATPHAPAPPEPRALPSAGGLLAILAAARVTLRSERRASKAKRG